MRQDSVWTDNFLYFAIYINEDLPNSIKNVPNQVKNFAKYKINPQNFVKSGHTAQLRQLQLLFVFENTYLT